MRLTTNQIEIFVKIARAVDVFFQKSLEYRWIFFRLYPGSQVLLVGSVFIWHFTRVATARNQAHRVRQEELALDLRIALDLLVISLASVPLPRIMLSPSATFYILALALAIATLLIAHGIYQSKLGLGLFAIHDDEDAAEVVGVPTYRYKLVAFGVSCGLAGVAGGIHALFISYVTANGTFNITVPLTVVLMSVLGGTRHWAGPALGAALITVLLYASTAAEQAVVRDHFHARVFPVLTHCALLRSSRWYLKPKKRSH